VRAGLNPYDPSQLTAAEREAGLSEADPDLDQIWNPPWTLALVLPLAFLPLRLAVGIWLVVQVGLLMVCGVLLWRYFMPGDGRVWIGLLLAAGFVPGLYGVRMGQIAFWFLLGVVGFLRAERAGRDLLAGVALALLTIKPHVTYLFLGAALLWVILARRWRVFAGLALALVVGSGIVMAFQPTIFVDYIAGAVSAPPLLRAPPTVGAWLRFALIMVGAGDVSWVQFVPSAVAVLLLLWWIARRREPWAWETVAAPLLLASPPTGVYGWTYDQLVMLPAVFAILVGALAMPAARRRLVVALLIASEVLLGAQMAVGIGEFWYVWHPLALAGLYQWTRRQSPGMVFMEHAHAS
jgi:hypothetical protein